MKVLVCAGLILLSGARNSRARQQGGTDVAASAERGHKEFVQSCGFCHGADATGARGPDLMRSPLVAHDVKGDQIGPVIRQGRPDKGMPAMPLNDAQILDIAAFLHARAAEAMRSSGKTFFNGAGGCTKCHSVTGYLAGVAGKHTPIELEARMLYPGGKHRTAVITLASGEQVKGGVEHSDDFVIAVRDEKGWYRSFRRDSVKVEIDDRLAEHRELLGRLTQKDVHNLFAYIETLK